MVLAVKEKDLPELRELADTFETELTILGDADGSGILKVTHHDATVCELDCSKLHDAPVRKLTSTWTKKTENNSGSPEIKKPLDDLLKEILSDFAIVSRAPIIREYDHEVQGNTVQKPLAGAKGDAPQDASVIRINGSEKLMSMSLSLLPQWGKTDPFAMGTACVDECIRQLVASGANPDKIAILDNFCLGNPENPEELGALVETVKGIAEAAEVYNAPFVSGKDSFYNYFETDQGPVSIPVTILISGMGVVEKIEHVTPSTLRQPDSVIAVIGSTGPELGGSILAKREEISRAAVPPTQLQKVFSAYRALHDAIKSGWIRSIHDVSEGGLGVALAEMAFGEVAGLDINLDELPADSDASKIAMLFGESPGRLILEIAPSHFSMVEALFSGQAFGKIGKATADHKNLSVEWGKEILLDESIADLKAIWKNGLAPYC